MAHYLEETLAWQNLAGLFNGDLKIHELMKGVIVDENHYFENLEMNVHRRDPYSSLQ